MNIFDKLRDKVVQYFDVKIRLIKISVIERSSTLLGYLFYSLILLFVVLAILIFLGFGLAEVFSDLFNSKALGYFMALLVYVIIMFILIASRRKIVRSFGNTFISIMTEQDEEEKKEETKK